MGIDRGVTSSGCSTRNNKVENVTVNKCDEVNSELWKGVKLKPEKKLQDSLQSLVEPGMKTTEHPASLGEPGPTKLLWKRKREPNTDTERLKKKRLKMYETKNCVLDIERNLCTGMASLDIKDLDQDIVVMTSDFKKNKTKIDQDIKLQGCEDILGQNSSKIKIEVRLD